MPETTRAQDRHLEALGWRHDSLRCTPLAGGSIRVDCMDRNRPADANRIVGPAAAGLRYAAGWILAPDGAREPVRW